MRIWLLVAFFTLSCGKGRTSELEPDAGAPDAEAIDATTDAGPTDAESTDPWAAVRDAIDRASIDDLTVQVGTSEGVQLTYSKGASSPSTPYSIASASKWLSSAVFMSLVEEGRLSLDDHPQDYLPFWTSDTNDPRSRITLEHLLAFTSGLPRDEPCPMLTTAECAQRIHAAAAGATLEPGTVFAYGGSHMQVAGAMAIAASGRANWSELFREHVGDPLGMAESAGFRPNPLIAGGASMSLDDYAKFVRAIFSRELLAGSLPVMEADHTPTSSVTIGYSPIAPTGYEWHYALGHWRECYGSTWSPECDQKVRISSPGAFGFYPVIDRTAPIPYWVIVAREDMTAMSGAESVRFGVEITPAIEAALGIE